MSANASTGLSNLYLEVIAGNALGSEIEVHDELIVGRQAIGAGALSDDQELSRQHARIARSEQGDFIVEDLASTNGTYLNGARITGPQRVQTGDELQIGSTTMRAYERATVASRDDEPTPVAPAGALPATAGAAEPVTAPPPPVLALRLEVDFAVAEARIAFNDDSGGLRFSQESGTWRIVR